MTQTITHYKGRYLMLHETNGWEYVSRRYRADVVIVLALTSDNELLLVEQYRRPVNAHTIELPAGLVGDNDNPPDEALETAAIRELEEETGYRAGSVRRLLSGPTSSGLTDEMVHLFLASELQQTGPGGGDASEDITVLKVPLGEIDHWLHKQTAMGKLLDPKIYAALYWVNGSAGSTD